MHRDLKTFLLIFFSFLTIIFIVTWGLLSGYFEQDEWLGIASTMRSYNLPWWNIFVARNFHFSPLGIFFWSSLYNVFKLQAQYYFLIELIIHSATASLVFILSFRLTKNKKIAFITSLLFLLNSRAHQAFTHLAIFHVTTTTMFFILLFFTYLTSIKEKVFSLKNIILLLAIFITAIFFREEGFVLVPLFIIYLFFLDKSKIDKKNIKYFAILFLGLIFGIFSRFMSQALNTIPVPTQYQVTTGNGLEYNLLTVPVKLVIQNLIWSERIVVFYINNHQKLFPGVFTNIYQEIQPLMDISFIFIFIALATLFLVWIWKYRPRKLYTLFTFLFSWILINAVVLSFVGRPLHILEPRYLYFSAFPVFLIFSIFLHSIYTIRNKNRYIDLLKKSIIILIISLIFIASFKEIRIAVDRMIQLGTPKVKLLSSLIEVHPSISKNTVFFVKCKDECYKNSEFGISNENVMPFPSGPGLNFLIFYASSMGNEKEWAPFLTEDFLFHYLSQGYKKIDDRGYGYFVDKDKLQKAIREENIPLKDIIALEYDEENYIFKDISETFRETLSEN